MNRLRHLQVVILLPPDRSLPILVTSAGPVRAEGWTIHQWQVLEKLLRPNNPFFLIRSFRFTVGFRRIIIIIIISNYHTVSQRLSSISIIIVNNQQSAMSTSFYFFGKDCPLTGSSGCHLCMATASETALVEDALAALAKQSYGTYMLAHCDR